MKSMRVLLVLLACVACNGGAAPEDAGTDASLFGDSSTIDPFGDAAPALRVRALFAQTCRGGPESGCHSSAPANFTATLDPDGGDVVGVPATEMPGLLRVEPYHPERSYLYWKVSNDPRIVPCLSCPAYGGSIDGGVMPASTGYDPRIPALIGPWIEAGAP